MNGNFWLDWVSGRRVAARLVWIALSFLLPLVVRLTIYWKSVSPHIALPQRAISGLAANRIRLEAHPAFCSPH